MQPISTRTVKLEPTPTATLALAARSLLRFLPSLDPGPRTALTRLRVATLEATAYRTALSLLSVRPTGHRAIGKTAVALFPKGPGKALAEAVSAWEAGDLERSGGLAREESEQIWRHLAKSPFAAPARAAEGEDLQLLLAQPTALADFFARPLFGRPLSNDLEQALAIWFVYLQDLGMSSILERRYRELVAGSFPEAPVLLALLDAWASQVERLPSEGIWPPEGEGPLGLGAATAALADDEASLERDPVGRFTALDESLAERDLLGRQSLVEALRAMCARIARRARPSPWPSSANGVRARAASCTSSAARWPRSSRAVSSRSGSTHGPTKIPATWQPPWRRRSSPGSSPALAAGGSSACGSARDPPTSLARRLGCPPPPVCGSPLPHGALGARRRRALPPVASGGRFPGRDRRLRRNPAPRPQATLGAPARGRSKNLSQAPQLRRAPGTAAGHRKSTLRALCDLRLENPRRGAHRLICFVDDLDRCRSETLLQTLEAIRLLMDEKDCIVVLGFDPRIALAMIGEHYKELESPAWTRQQIARDYLGKVVQLVIRLDDPHRIFLERFVAEQLFPLPPGESGRTSGSASPEEPEPRAMPSGSPARTACSGDRSSQASATPVVDLGSEMRHTAQEQTLFSRLAAEHRFTNPRLLLRLRNGYRFLRLAEAESGFSPAPLPLLMRAIFWQEFLHQWPREIRLRLDAALLSDASLTDLPETASAVLRIVAPPLRKLLGDGEAALSSYRALSSMASLLVLPHGD